MAEMTSVSFAFETKYGLYSDAIWFPADAPMSEEDIEAEKHRRLSNWVNMIENPTPPQGE